MGQFINQPDFATEVETISAFPATATHPSALYVGVVTDPATMTVKMQSGQSVTFTGVKQGFYPIVVTEVTSVVGIAAADIMFVR